MNVEVCKEKERKVALKLNVGAENQSGGVLQEHDEHGHDELCTAEMISIPIVLSQEPQLSTGDSSSLSSSR